MKNAKSDKRMSMMLQSLDALMRIAIHSDTIDEFEPEDSTQLYAKKNEICDSIDQISDAIAEPEDEGDFGGNNEDEHEVTFGDDDTGKSLSEALLFAEHVENLLCTKIVLNVRNNFCKQHVLSRFELGIFMD